MGHGRQFMLNQPKYGLKQYKLWKIDNFLDFIGVSLVFINNTHILHIKYVMKILRPKSYYIGTFEDFRNEISHEIPTSPDLFTIYVFITALLKNGMVGVEMIL